MTSQKNRRRRQSDVLSATSSPPHPTTTHRPPPARACFALCKKTPQCAAWVHHAAHCAGRQRHALCELLADEGTLVLPTAARGDDPQRCERRSGVLRAAEKGLVPLQYAPLRLGSVAVSGWLRRQLIVMANGLSGHLDAFWDDIMNSVGGGGGRRSRGSHLRWSPC